MHIGCDSRFEIDHRKEYMNLEIEGFSATQRTIIDSGLQAFEISTSTAKDEEEERT